MSFTMPLTRGRLTLKQALRSDHDCLHDLSMPERRLALWTRIYQARSEMVSVASSHLGIPESDIAVEEVKHWSHGSFNMCIPLVISANHHAQLPAKVLFRVPMPHRVGEGEFAGNIGEKVRSEAATYLWLGMHAPDIPIPRLFGFGLPDGRSASATPLGHLPLTFFERPAFHGLGYILIEFIDKGKMLSCTWDDHQHDLQRRDNLYRGISRIMLATMGQPMPRIGSWTITDQGQLTLGNRPMTFDLFKRESCSIPTGIARNCTYSAPEPYYSDLLAVQENRMRVVANSMHNKRDGENQLAMLTAMRALLPRFSDRQLRNGPFIMMLTDLHRSNFFVDDDWNIIYVIDLEWTASLPAELISSPYWLTSKTPEQLAEDGECARYGVFHERFAATFEEEEQARYGTNRFANIMRQHWTSHAFWYFTVLYEPTLLDCVFRNRIGPLFLDLDGKGSAERAKQVTTIMSSFFDFDTAALIAKKIKDQKQYNFDLRAFFATAEKKLTDKAAESAKKESAATNEAATADSSKASSTSEGVLAVSAPDSAQSEAGLPLNTAEHDFVGQTDAVDAELKSSDLPQPRPGEGTDSAKTPNPHQIAFPKLGLADASTWRL